jgi:hypothetical protein
VLEKLYTLNYTNAAGLVDIMVDHTNGFVALILKPDGGGKPDVIALPLFKFLDAAEYIEQREHDLEQEELTALGDVTQEE